MNRPGPYLCLDAHIRSDEKLAKVTPTARYLFIILASYCAGELTDGRIPEVILPQLYPAAGAKPKHLAELVAVGLVEPLVMDDGYYLPAYLTWNPSRAELQAQRDGHEHVRELWRERQRRKRDKEQQAS